VVARGIAPPSRRSGFMVFETIIIAHQAPRSETHHERLGSLPAYGVPNAMLLTKTEASSLPSQLIATAVIGAPLEDTPAKT